MPIDDDRVNDKGPYILVCRRDMPIRRLQCPFPTLSAFPASHSVSPDTWSWSCGGGQRSTRAHLIINLFGGGVTTQFIYLNMNISTVVVLITIDENRTLGSRRYLSSSGGGGAEEPRSLKGINRRVCEGEKTYRRGLRRHRRLITSSPMDAPTGTDR